jgi:hypothetical protein
VTGAEVIALVTGLPAVISAVTALIIAIRGARTAKAAFTTAGLTNDVVLRHMARPGVHPNPPLGGRDRYREDDAIK